MRRMIACAGCKTLSVTSRLRSAGQSGQRPLDDHVRISGARKREDLEVDDLRLKPSFTVAQVVCPQPDELVIEAQHPDLFRGLYEAFPPLP